MVKRIMVIGILLAVTALPCWGNGTDDFTAAGSRWDAGNKQEALDLYQKAISSGDLSDARLLDAHYNSAVLYFLLREYKGSMLEIDKVLKAKPDHVPAIGLRASIWVAVGKKYGYDTSAKALADWAKVLEIDPLDANTYNDRAMFYVERNEDEKAIDDLEKFMALEPDNPDQRYLLEQLKKKVAEKKDSAAEQ